MGITSKQLSCIAPNLKEPKLSLYTNHLNDTMDQFGIDTLNEQAAFLAEVMHESGECRYVKELASGAAYEGRKDLGNTNKGDGVTYKGRGLIQLTGKTNYTLLSKAFGIDFVANPVLLESPEWATKSAGWFWKSKNLSPLSDKGTEESFKAVTKIINGGYNGLADRITYWERAKKVLGI